MSKGFEKDYQSHGIQPELPAELLPTPVDDGVLGTPLTASEENRIQAEEIAADPRIPEAARPAVVSHLVELSDDIDRVNSQAQTTDNGPDARSRATVETEEDRSAREIEEISKRARRLVDSPARQQSRRVTQANIKRHFGETGPSSKALGEI